MRARAPRPFACANGWGSVSYTHLDVYKRQLQTLRADIDYGFAEAKTAYGRLGVKVWIYKGQVLPTAKKAPAKTEGGK